MKDALSDFSSSSITLRGDTRTVYEIGDGPVVIVLSEIPGITPLVANFARHTASRGFRVVMPHLFGDDGREPTSRYANHQILRACISREFTLFATKKPSRITAWLTDLCHYVSPDLPVGVVGMCLTGGFGLAMMTDPIVAAPVLSQPSLPIGPRRSSKRALGISDRQLAEVKERVADGACVLGLRFTGDAYVPAERFARLRQELGEGFIGIEIDSSEANPWGYRRDAHSVLTEDLGTNPESPTQKALEQVMAFFEERLRP
jgi:dienelactone hydrolase